MRIETISTGDEVITGFIADTNYAWFSQKLLDCGLQIKRHQTVGDDLFDLSSILDERSKFADIIIVNGGLGPTSDDKTSEAVAQVLKVPLIEDDVCLQHIKKFFEVRQRKMDPSNLKQALLPKGATVIPNDIGTACGYKIKINNALCYFTPGVPSEFKKMVNNYIIPDLQNLSDYEHTKVLRYFVLGVSESSIGGVLDKVKWPKNIVLGYRAAFPIVEIKLISRNANQEDIIDSEKLLLKYIDPCLVSKNEFNIPALISKLCGVVPLQVIEYGTGGQILSSLSNHMPFVTGHFMPLPSDADSLIKIIKKEKQRTVAIGAESEHGFPIVYWNGMIGYMQILKSSHPNMLERKTIISCAVLDMIRRILSGKNPFPPFETLERTYSLEFKHN